MEEKRKVPRIRFKGFDEDWEQRKFNCVFDFISNNTLSRAELNYDTGDVRNVHYGDVLINFNEYTDVNNARLPFIIDSEKADKAARARLEDGDIVIADTAEDETVGKCTEIAGIGDSTVVSGLHTMPCRPKEKFAPGYLGFYLNSNAYHDQLRPLMQGIKVTSISKSAISDTDILFPKNVNEQHKIGDFFRNIDTTITLHQHKLKTYIFRFFHTCINIQE